MVGFQVRAICCYAVFAWVSGGWDGRHEDSLMLVYPEL